MQAISKVFEGFKSAIGEIGIENSIINEFLTPIIENSEIPKGILLEKKKLFLRGLKNGSIIVQNRKINTSLPDWYINHVINTEVNEENSKKMLNIVKERQAYFFLFNEWLEIHSEKQ